METHISELLDKFPKYKDAANDKWENVPITTRNDIENWTIDKCPEKPVLIAMTSGSTGKPVIVYFNKSAVLSKIDSLKNYYKGFVQENDLFYHFMGPPNLIRASIEGMFFDLNKLCVAFDVPNKDNANKIISAISLAQPSWIIGTISGINALLELGIPIKARAMVVGGSLINKKFQESVCSYFGCKYYFNAYASNEFGVIASNVENSDELVVKSNLLLEVLDDNGKINEEGTGKLLVTDYTNFSMPFIRYVLGDRVILHKENGKTYIEVLGRNDNLFNFDEQMVSSNILIVELNNLLGHDKFYITINHHEISLYDYAEVHILLEDVNKEPIIKEKLTPILRKPPVVIGTEKMIQSANGKYINFIDLRKTKSSGVHW